MNFLKPFEEKHDVDLGEIKDWLGDFRDEYPMLKFKLFDIAHFVDDWVGPLAFDKRKLKGFNIIIYLEEDLSGTLLREKDYPIHTYIPFLSERLSDRGMEIVDISYGTVISCIKIVVISIPK